MNITWYGHSCFKIVSAEGIILITDPFDERVGYDVPRLTADIITISHNHYDHNNTSVVKSEHILINKLEDNNIYGIKVKGFKTYHDNERGSKRGDNNIYRFSIDSITIAHLGDLGHEIGEELLKELGTIDLLLIPIGGIYTIDSVQAIRVVKSINPKIVIPMHYKTDKLRFDLEPVDNFLKYFDNVNIRRNEIEITRDMLRGSTKVIVLNYK